MFRRRVSETIKRAKTVLAPQTSNSEKWTKEYADPKRIELCEIARGGYKGSVTDLTYDPVLGLLAISTNECELILFGKPGIEKVLTVSNSCTIVRFLVGTGYLVGAAGCDLYTLDLDARNLRCDTLESKITALESPVDCRWVFVGLASGKIASFDVVNCCLGTFMMEFPTLDLNSRDIDLSPSPVSHLRLNVMNPGLLLASYARSGITVLYEIIHRRIFNVFRYGDVVTALAWNASGDAFLAAYDEGYVCSWDIDDRTESPSHVMSPAIEKAERGAINPVLGITPRISYTGHADRDIYLLILGPALRLIASNKKEMIIIGETVEEQCIDKVSVITRSPWWETSAKPVSSSDERDWQALLLLTSDGTVEARRWTDPPWGGEALPVLALNGTLTLPSIDSIQAMSGPGPLRSPGERATLDFTLSGGKYVAAEPITKTCPWIATASTGRVSFWEFASEPGVLNKLQDMDIDMKDVLEVFKSIEPNSSHADVRWWFANEEASTIYFVFGEAVLTAERTRENSRGGSVRALVRPAPGCTTHLRSSISRRPRSCEGKTVSIAPPVRPTVQIKVRAIDGEEQSSTGSLDEVSGEALKFVRTAEELESEALDSTEHDQSSDRNGNEPGHDSNVRLVPSMPADSKPETGAANASPPLPNPSITRKPRLPLSIRSLEFPLPSGWSATQVCQLVDPATSCLSVSTLEYAALVDGSTIFFLNGMQVLFSLPYESIQCDIPVSHRAQGTVIGTVPKGVTWIGWTGEILTVIVGNTMAYVISSRHTPQLYDISEKESSRPITMSCIVDSQTVVRGDEAHVFLLADGTVYYRPFSYTIADGNAHKFRVCSVGREKSSEMIGIVLGEKGLHVLSLPKLKLVKVLPCGNPSSDPTMMEITPRGDVVAWTGSGFISIGSLITRRGISQHRIYEMRLVPLKPDVEERITITPDNPLLFSDATTDEQPSAGVFAALRRGWMALRAREKPVFDVHDEPQLERFLKFGATTAVDHGHQDEESLPLGAVEQRGSDTSGKATNIFGATKRALEERGERLEQLEEKFSHMENQARSFADMARELRKREEQKGKLFGMF